MATAADRSASSVRPVLAVGAVVIVERHLLLVTRANPPAKGLWSVPGGRVEPGERMADAVVREVAEETGLAVACGPPVGWVERIGPDHHFVIFDFQAYPLEADTGVASLSLAAGDDAGEARWVPVAELDGMSLVPGLLDFLSDNGVFRGVDGVT